jgi:septal ring factor EnvC (AmiA/AmiB activator)
MFARHLPVRSLCLASILAFAVAGCTEQEDHVHLNAARGEVEVAQGVLPPEELARLEATFDRVIQDGEHAVAKLEADIASLERANADRAAQINTLISQIESRRAVLEQQYQQNLILCVFFPVPSICILANFISNDTRMQEFNHQLQRVRDEKARAEADIRRYGKRRDALRAQLVPVRDSKARLIARFRAGIGDSPAELAESPETAGAYARADALGSVADATAQEIALLRQIRAAAIDLASSLDAALATIETVAENVDDLVRQARDEFMNLLEGLLFGDPAGVAADFLDDAIAARTRHMLASLGWPVSELVHHLVSTRGDDPSLEPALLAKLGNGAAD